MTAMEKTAWTELIVSITAVAAVSALVPWLEARAAGAFGLLGLIGFAALFLRKSGNQVIVDERDRAIEMRAANLGISVAWFVMFGSLIAAVLWSNYSQTTVVSTAFLNWLIWIQFAVCYGTKGLTSVLLYRGQYAA